MKLHLDFETRSTVDLTKVGAWAYASHPSTDLLSVALAVDDKKVLFLPREYVYLNKPGSTMLQAIDAGARLVAHNVQFEYAVYHFILHKRYGWPELLDPARWDCTMARALMCGLPASLEGLALALNLPYRKDLEGRGALMKICKPQKDGTFNEDPALYAKVYAYNALDVEVERAADKSLPELPPDERRVFESDLRINRRGILLDLGAARKAAEIAESLTDGLNADLRRLTNGAVSKASRVAELKRWVAAQGVKIPTVVKVDPETNEEEIKETLDVEAVKDLVKDPATPALVKRVVGIRQQVGKSSVAKLKTMLTCTCADGRFRGAFQYCGAHTGRWTGRVLQLHNFPQGLTGAEQEEAIQMLDEGAGFFALRYEARSMQTLSDVLRGLLVAPQGKVFVGGDFNAIEARVIFWLANEQAALAQYARGESPYLTMGAKIFGRSITKKDNREYMVAKMTVLGAGFGMGWLRFQAQVYTETSKRGEALDIDDKLAQDAIYGYRKLYARVVGLWYETEAAAVRAVQAPGSIHLTAGGRVAWGMSKDRQFLSCRLPSGRLLRYFRPHLVQRTDGREGHELRYWTSAGPGCIKTDCNGALGEYRTWGGELVENVVQAVARDLLVEGMLNVEKAGYNVVLHAHDELLAETGGVKDADFFTHVMEQTPEWAAGLPVKAEGWIGRRYQK